MVLITLVLLICAFYAIYIWKSSRGRNRGDLDLIPGPKENPWWKVFRPGQGTPSHKIPHLATTALAKMYGPIFKHTLLTGETYIVVSSFELIYKVLVSEGKVFGGRSAMYRMNAAFDATGIAQNIEPDEKWRLLRRISQRHLRQFGDGLSRIENIITFVADEMFKEFDEHTGSPFNPKAVTTDAARNSIAFLISGEKGSKDSTLNKKLRQYEEIATQVLPTVSIPISYQLLDAMPWLRFFGLSSWKMIQKLRRIERIVWNEVVDMNKSNPESQSICKVFQEHMETSDGTGPLITINDARKSSLSLLLAGVVTTSRSLYAAINILAHHPATQDRILKEILDVADLEIGVTLRERHQMPYCRAVIYEALRYHSITSLGLAHRACADTTLGGFAIPAGTRVVTALYLMHHDEEFWGDPFDFRPERFLDEDGQLVPADHPNRKHLMPFGAGTRACLGESLALTRLFLWISNMVLKYRITPAPGNLKSSVDSRNYRFTDAVLSPPQYQVIFTRRA